MPLEATCHFSGLLIKSGEPVIVLPVSYGEEQTVVSHSYNTSDYACPFWLPFEGILKGFNDIEFDESETSSKVMFLNFLNKYFVNLKNEKEYGFSNKFAVLKHGKDDVLRGEFYKTHEIFSKFKNKEFYPVEKIDSINQFFNFCSTNSFFNIKNSNCVFRIGFIVIKKSVFCKFIKKTSHSKLEKIKNDVIDFLEQKNKAFVNYNNANFKILSDEEAFDIQDDINLSADHLKSSILGMFNGSNLMVNNISIGLKLFWSGYGNCDNTNIANSISLFSAIDLSYQKIGKTYFPNSYVFFDDSGVLALAESIIEEDMILDKKD